MKLSTPENSIHVFLGIAALFLFTAGCHSAPPTEPIVLHGRAMGTTWQVTLAESLPAADVQPLQELLAARIEALEQQTSHWRSDSAVSRFNQHRETGPFEIPAEVAEVIEEANTIHQLSAGAIDITAAPLVNRWGFGPAGRQQRLPYAEEIEKLMPLVDQRLLELEQREQTWYLRKQVPQVEIDLSAIAKGYAVDQMASVLQAEGLENYLIELGGELRGHGVGVEAAPWRVGLEIPVAEATGELHAKLKLLNASIATSGNYRNFVARRAGSTRRYSHVIDPRTGWPIEHEVAAVSVVDQDCMRADAWATALLVLGPKQGLQVAQQQNLAACFVTMSDDGPQRQVTSQFDDLLLPLD